MKDFKIYIIIASLLMIGYVVAQYNKPKPVNWQSTLYRNDKIPFGTFILYDQLKELFPGAQVINTNKSAYNVFHNGNLHPGNYIIIAQKISLNKFDFEEMLKYIRAGNSVFMSAFEWQGHMADSLKIDSRAEPSKNNMALNFTSKFLKTHKDYVFNRDIANQSFTSLDTVRATVIGKNNDGHSTFLRYDFGKGSLYVCATPAVFTNYSLLTKQGVDYAAKALSYMPSVGYIYWDQYQNGDIPEDISPLRVFFSNPGLQWAYYLSIFSMMVFIIYEVKRRQRVIPVIEPLQNSTLDFVTVVGQVYYEKRDNANIAHKKVIYLFEYLRDHYRLKTNKLDQEFSDMLSKKTGIDSQLATDLTHAITFLDTRKRVTDQELINLNKLIEKFYSQSAYNGK